jgi:hypothetical protein
MGDEKLILKIPWADIPTVEWTTTYQLGSYECMSIITLRDPIDSIKYAFKHMSKFEMNFVNNELISFSAES